MPARAGQSDAARRGPALAAALGGVAATAATLSRGGPTFAVLPSHATAATSAATVASSSAAAPQASSPAAAAAVASAVGAGAALTAAAASRRAGRRGRRTAMAAGDAVVSNLPMVDRNTTKAYRRELMRSDQYFKFGKTQMEKAMAELQKISGSDLLAEIRANGFRLTVGDVTFVLAESYGFCWGVERAVAMAYEARNFFPDKKVWVTNEIIHNPLVNENLEKLGFEFVKVDAAGQKDFSKVEKGDVVILPAFGASIDEMAFLKDREVQMVDTTCPWVSKVWNSVEKSKEKGHTAIIHGKYAHEETIATMSFAKKYLVVKNMPEAEYVVQYVLGNGDREEFMKKFANAMPEGFDPDVDLDKVGVANQTTMLKGETELIGKLFERTMIRKFGPQEIDSHFVSFNTICDATQERQDAMYKMFGAEYQAPSSKLYAEMEGEQIGVELKSEKNAEKLDSKSMEEGSKGAAAEAKETETLPRVDMCLVVGGFNSSNTFQLGEICNSENVPFFHVDCAERIGGADGTANEIQHKPLSTTPQEAMLDQGLEIDKGFLPEGKLVVGVTSGASTPDSVVGDCLKRFLAIKGTA